MFGIYHPVSVPALILFQPYLLPLCWIWIIFHIIVVHNQRLCHDLDQGYLVNSAT